MSTQINLERNSGIVTEGIHLFKITKAEEQASKSSGMPMITLTCVCQDAGEDQGKQVPLFLSLVPAARFKIDELLDALDAPKRGSWDLGQFVGKSFKAVVKHTTYEDRVQANLSRIIPAGSTASPQIPATVKSPGSGLPEDSAEVPSQKPIF